jgi:hypothetical protein
VGSALEEALLDGLGQADVGAPTVRVRYRVDREEVLAEVEDDSPGFDPDDPDCPPPFRVWIYLCAWPDE